MDRIVLLKEKVSSRPDEGAQNFSGGPERVPCVNFILTSSPNGFNI